MEADDEKKELLGDLPESGREMVGRMLTLMPRKRPVVEKVLESGWL